MSLERSIKAVLQSLGVLQKMAPTSELLNDHEVALNAYLCRHQCAVLGDIIVGSENEVDVQLTRTLKRSTAALWDVSQASQWRAQVRLHSFAVVAMTEEFKNALSGPPVIVPPDPDPVADWILSPNSYLEEATDKFVNTNNPIQDVLGAKYWSSSSRNRPRLVQPGQTMFLLPGEYRHWRLTDDIFDDWITIEGSGTDETFIKFNEVGGSQSVYYEAGGKLRLKNFTIRADDRMGIGTENPFSRRWGGNFMGFGEFEHEDIVIDGRGISKELWGVLTWGMKSWKWVGGGVYGIDKEHGLGYFHNSQGPVLIEDAECEDCGRTAYQEANRHTESGGLTGLPPAKGPVTLRGNRVLNVGQEGGGIYGLSFHGRRRGTVLVEDCEVIEDGTVPSCTGGAMVTYAGGGTNKGTPESLTDEVIVRNGLFRSANPDVTVASYSAFGSLRIEGTTHFESGNNRPALEIKGSKDSFHIDPGVTAKGKVLHNGKVVSLDDLR